MYNAVLRLPNRGVHKVTRALISTVYILLCYMDIQMFDLLRKELGTCCAISEDLWANSAAGMRHTRAVRSAVLSVKGFRASPYFSSKCCFCGIFPSRHKCSMGEHACGAMDANVAASPMQGLVTRGCWQRKRWAWGVHHRGAYSSTPSPYVPGSTCHHLRLLESGVDVHKPKGP